MSRQKKPLKQRLLSLLLFVSITWLVFNVEFLIHQGSILIGVKELDFHEIQKINLDFDDALNSRPIIMAHSDHVVVSFSNELTIYNKNGKSISKKEINSDNSEIIGLTDYFVVVDMTHGHLQFLDYLGNDAGKVNSLGEIKFLVEVPNNMVVVITESYELFVYRYDNVLISKIGLTPRELLGLDLSADESEILVTGLVSSDKKYTSEMHIFDTNNFNQLGAINNYNRIVLGARLVNGLVVIVDDIGQMARDVRYAEEVLWENNRDGILTHFKIDNNGNMFEIVTLESVEDLVGKTSYQINGWNQDGKLIFENKLKHGYDKIELQGGQVMLQSDRNILILDSSGETLLTFDSPRKIISSQWLSNTRILVEYNDYFSIYELKY